MSQRNIVAAVMHGDDTYLVLRDPVSHRLFSIAHRGSSRVVPEELRQTFKDEGEAVAAIRSYLRSFPQINADIGSKLHADADSYIA